MVLLLYQFIFRNTLFSHEYYTVQFSPKLFYKFQISKRSMESENAQSNSPTGFFGKHPSLKIKEFQSYLILRLGIIFALNMQSTTIYFWVYQMTNDKLSLGLVGLAEVIPAICCSFFSGHVVDQNEKRKMVAICLLGYIIVGIALFL